MEVNSILKSIKNGKCKIVDYIDDGDSIGNGDTIYIFGCTSKAGMLKFLLLRYLKPN
jgi:hypothetical protein